jgi:hypothetical protein
MSYRHKPQRAGGQETTQTHGPLVKGMGVGAVQSWDHWWTSVVPEAHTSPTQHERWLHTRQRGVQHLAIPPTMLHLLPRSNKHEKFDNKGSMRPLPCMFLPTSAPGNARHHNSELPGAAHNAAHNAARNAAHNDVHTASSKHHLQYRPRGVYASASAQDPQPCL